MSTFQSYIEPGVAVVPSLSPLGKRSRNSSIVSVFGEDFSPKRQREFEIEDFSLSTPPGSADSATLDLEFMSSATSSPQQLILSTSTSTWDIDSICDFDPIGMMNMQPAADSSRSFGHIPSNQEFYLQITEQPEEYYRARYESEGVRAPLKGMFDNHPTVRVVAGPGQRQLPCGGRVDVKLVYEDGSDHLSCSLDVSEDRKNALTKKIGPHNNMTTEFEDLRIRREKKKESGKKQIDKSGIKPDSRNDKVAHLLFTATLDMGPDFPQAVLKAISSQITLNSPPDPAELDWVRPTHGHFRGGEEIVIKGSKMTSPKVTFHITLPKGQQYDLPGIVEKDKSHQNVLLVKTPALPPVLMGGIQQKIWAQLTVSTGRSPRHSNPLQFCFLPDEVCIQCLQPVGQHSTSSSPTTSYMHPTVHIPSAISPPPPRAMATPSHGAKRSASLPLTTIQHLPQLPNLMMQVQSPSSPTVTGGSAGNGGDIPLPEIHYRDVDSTVTTCAMNIPQSSFEDNKTGITYMGSSMTPEQLIPLQYQVPTTTTTDELLFWMEQTTASSSSPPHSMSIDSTLHMEGVDLSMQHYQQPAVSPVSFASDSPPMTPQGNRSPPLGVVTSSRMFHAPPQLLAQMQPFVPTTL